MPQIDVKLIHKNLCIRIDSSGESKTLIFEARFEGREQLENSNGDIATTGHIEFTLNNPRFATSQMHFVESYKDPDTNSMVPATFSFYADLTKELFDQLSSFYGDNEISLRIHTMDLVGSIEYGNDPNGYSKIWNIEKENPVIPESYEIIISSNPS